MFIKIGALITSVINLIKTAFRKNASSQVVDRASATTKRNQFGCIKWVNPSDASPRSRTHVRLKNDEMRKLTEMAMVHALSVTKKVACVIEKPETLKSVLALDPLVARPNANDTLGGEFGFFQAYHTYVKATKGSVAGDLGVAMCMLRDALIAAALLRCTERTRIMVKLRTTHSAILPVFNGLPEWARTRHLKAGHKRRADSFKRNQKKENS